MQWRDGWPQVKQQDIDQLQVNELVPPTHLWPARPVRDNFSASELDDVWNTIGPPDADTRSLTQRPGFLRLYGQESLLSFGAETAFVGRRQTERKSQSQTQLEFAPRSDNEEAGLTVLMSPSYH